MNRFVRHHRQSIRFGYACFDRIICNGIIQTLQDGRNVQRFFAQRGETVTHKFLVSLSSQYHQWLEHEAAARDIEVIAVERGVRRETLVQPYFERLQGRSGLAVVLKCREPERIAVSFARRGHAVELVQRWVNLYYFYLQHPQCGRIFLRVCPYFPFNARLWMNGHDWLASRLRAEGIAFQQRDNAFSHCADPERLQQLANAFGPEDITATVEPLLQEYIPYFSDDDRRYGLQHRWFMAQIEYCHNLVFHQRAALVRLFERLLDHNRGLGRPDKLGTIFRRRVFRPETAESGVKVTMLGTPVIRTAFNSTSIKQYVKDGGLLRTEAASYQLRDLNVLKNIHNLPPLRRLFADSLDRYLDAQQDILETYVDRGQLEQLRQPTLSAGGRRTPGMRLDDQRLLAVLQALTAFVYLLGKGCFRTKHLLPHVRQALSCPQYKLSQLRYDLAKLRGKGLLHRLPSTQTYRLTDVGYRIAVLYLKLYHRLYAPLIAAIVEPYPPDDEILSAHRVKLDRLYAAVDQTLKKLTDHLGIAQPA
jgi:hypothetical protein